MAESSPSARPPPLQYEWSQNMTNLLVVVEHKDDPVPCPKCGKKAQKADYPFKPMPPDPTNAKQMATLFIGRVYCEECDDTFPWCYRAAS